MKLLPTLINLYQRHSARRMFGRWAPVYEEEVAANAYSAADAVAQAAIRHLARAGVHNPKIADVGIGTGLLAQQIHDAMPCRITGLDFSEDMMAACAGRGITELLIKCDVGRDEPWPLPPTSFDAVVAAGLFEYLTDDMVANVFLEASELLKPGGLLILTYVPVKEGEKETALWHGHSGTYIVCRAQPVMIEARVMAYGFTMKEHTGPFKGCVFADGSSYDYRLIVAERLKDEGVD